MLHQALELYEGSAGAGEHRGGFGYAREFRVVADEMRMSCFLEKVELSPWGLFGGKQGKRSAVLVSRGGGDFETFVKRSGSPATASSQTST